MSDNGKDIRRALKAAAQTPKKPNPYKDDVIYDPMGQWKYPGQVTKIPDRNITMRGVNYPVLGVDDLGNQQMMQPGMDYTFPGQNVTEYPQMAQEGKTILPKDYSQFEEYNKTAPENRVPDKDWQYGNSKQYDHYGMWDALGKPKNFQEALKNNPQWTPDEYDNMYHGFSANPNTGVWLKPFTPGEHEPGSTAWMEYAATQLNPELAKNYRVIYDTDLKRMKGVPKEKYGGWLDEEEFRRGGPTNPLMLSRSKRRKTSKNIQSSINKLFLRNRDLFGPGGKNIYDPKSKYEFGGAFDQYDEGGTDPPGTSDKPIASKKQAYQTAIKNNYQKYLDDIKYSTPYTDVTEGGMNCIHGVCQVVKGTGAKNFMEDYTGNQTFKDARKKEGYYEADPINEGFEIGDIIQYAKSKEHMAGDDRYKGKVTPANAKELVPSHAKVILDKYVDKEGVTRYKIGHNQGKDEFMFSKDDDGGDIKEETLIKHFSEGFNSYDGIIVNRYDPDYVAKKEKEDADDIKKIKGENLYAPLYKGATKIKALEHVIPETQNLLNFYKKNYQKLGKSADMPPQVLDQIFHNEVGIFGQESDFGKEGSLKDLVPDTFLPAARKLQEKLRSSDDWITDYWTKNADEVQTKFSTKEQFAQSIKNRNKLSPEAREYLRYEGPRSKGGFQQKELSKRGRILGSNFDTQENQFLSSMYLAIDNYHLLKKKYPDLGDNELVDLTTLMHNAPSKALTPEYVNYYLKNNNIDYVNKVKQKRGNVVVDTQPSYIQKLKQDSVNKISPQEVSAIENFLKNSGSKKFGGPLDQYQNAGQLRAASSTAAIPVSTQAPINPINPQAYESWPEMVSRKWKNRDPNRDDPWELIMPDTHGGYTGSGVTPFDLMLGAPQDVVKTLASKAVKGLPKGANAKPIPTGSTVGHISDVERVAQQNRVGRGNPFVLKAGNNKYYSDIQDINDSYLAPEFNNLLNKYAGHTDVPAFNKEVQHLKTQAQYGKRPLEVREWMDPGVQNFLAKRYFQNDISSNMFSKKLARAQFNINDRVTDVIPSNYFRYYPPTKFDQPFNAKDAFKTLSPNKYGGQQKGWLDNLT